MASPWDAFPVVEQQAPQRGGGVFIPDPGALDDKARADEDQAMQRQKMDVDVGNTGFNQRDKLRSDYNALPAVKEYRVAVQALAASLKRGSDGSGDTALIYDYVKALDPTSVVREAEVGMAASGASTVEAAAAKLKKEFGIEGGGNLPPEVRNRLRREIITSVIPRVKQYNQMRGQFETLAQRNGFDPYEIVGDHDANPYVETFREYDRTNGLGEFARGQGQRGAIPGATMDSITFDMDTGTGAFGSQIQADRLNPQQQAALDAFLKANAGNPNFGPDQLSAFYQSIGQQGGAMPGDDRFYEAVRSGEAFATQPNYAEADAERRKWAEDQVRAQLGDDQIGGTVAFQNGILPWSDEIMGLRGGITAMLAGDDITQGYQDARDVERAAVRLSEAEHGSIPKIAGSLMTPAGLLSRGNLARDALAMGAMYGAGEGEGLSDTVGKTLTGAGLGYAAGKAFDAAAPVIANSAVGRRVSQALNNRGQGADEFAAAAERQGLDYLPADIPGRTGTQFATSISKSTLGGIPLADAAAKIVDKAKAARDRIAGNVGAAADNVGAGQAAQRGMEAWEKQTAGRGGQLYEAIPIKPDMPVDLSTTRQTLADLNNSISSNAELATLVRDPRMAAYQKALEAGDLSWQDIKSFRTYIGEKAGRPTLQQDTSKDSLDALYGALSQDIQRAATAHSPEAAKAFTRANNYWRGRQTRLNDVMTKLVGKDGNMSPEATFAQIERWAGVKGGDYSSLARAVRSMPDDEANTIRATIIDRLGDASAGRQNADQSAFSPDTFLTQWANLSDRAKAVLFQGEHRKALDDLATVFDGSKFSRGFDNNSRTGIAASGIASAGLTVAEPLTGMAMAGLQLATGKLLASPRFARWLAASAKKPNPSAQLAHVNQLTAIARSEPVIANDIFTLQERLAAEFSRSPGSLAAQDTGDGRGEPPAQGERGNAP